MIRDEDARSFRKISASTASLLSPLAVLRQAGVEGVGPYSLPSTRGRYPHIDIEANAQKNMIQSIMRRLSSSNRLETAYAPKMGNWTTPATKKTERAIQVPIGVTI